MSSFLTGLPSPRSAGRLPATGLAGATRKVVSSAVRSRPDRKLPSGPDRTPPRAPSASARPCLVRPEISQHPRHSKRSALCHRTQPTSSAPRALSEGVRRCDETRRLA